MILLSVILRLFILSILSVFTWVLYLGGLDKSLITPPKLTPRLQVEKGAAIIANALVGNTENKAVLEMTMAGAKF